jgi:hypothetical protein
VFLEVKVELLSESQLKKVVVQRLLAHIHFLRCVLKRVAHNLPFLVRHTVVQLSPQRHFFDDVLNRSFFCALLLWSVALVRIVDDIARLLSCGYTVYLLAACVVVGILLLFFRFPKRLTGLPWRLVLLGVQVLRLWHQNGSRKGLWWSGWLVLLGFQGL